MLFTDSGRVEPLPGCSLADWQQVCRHNHIKGPLPCTFSAHEVFAGIPNSPRVSIQVKMLTKHVETGHDTYIYHNWIPHSHECATPEALRRAAKVLYDHEADEWFTNSSQQRPFNPHV